MVQFLSYSLAFVNVSENKSTEFHLSQTISYWLNIEQIMGAKTILNSFIHFEIQD